MVKRVVDTRKGKGIPSSSVKDENPGMELAKDFGCPFPLFTIGEGEKFKEFNNKSFVGMLHIDYQMLESHNLSDDFLKYVKLMKWDTFIDMKLPVRKEWMIEFLVTLEYVDVQKKNQFKFRHAGDEYVCGFKDMHTWFKFPLEGVTMMPPKYQATPFWNAITGSGRFYPKNSSNRLIKDNCLMLFHKFLSHALFGRVESSKVQLKDVFVLSLLQENKTPCSISSIFEGLFAASKSKQKTVGMGHMITGIILGCLGQLRGFEPNEGEQIQYLNEGLLKNAHLVSTTNGGLKFVSYEARTAKFLAGKDKGKATVTNQDVSEEEDEEEDDEAMNMDAPITEIIGKGKRKADVTNQHVSEEKNEEEDDEAANMDAPITEIIGKGKRKADVTNQDMSEEKDEDDDDEAAVMDAPTTEIEGWKQVLQRLDIMDRNHQNLVGQLGRIEHEVKKMRREHKSLTRNVMSYQNMEFSLTPPGSPSNDT